MTPEQAQEFRDLLDTALSRGIRFDLGIHPQYTDDAAALLSRVSYLDLSATDARWHTAAPTRGQVFPRATIFTSSRTPRPSPDDTTTDSVLSIPEGGHR